MSSPDDWSNKRDRAPTSRSMRDFANNLSTPSKADRKYGLASKGKVPGGPLSAPRSSSQRTYGWSGTVRDVNYELSRSSSAQDHKGPRQKISPGSSLTNIRQHNLETPRSKQSWERPLSSGTSVPVHIKRKATPKSGPVIDIASDSEPETKKRPPQKALTTLIEEATGQPIASSKPRKRPPARKSYSSKGALVNDTLFKGTTTLVLDTSNNHFSLRLPKRQPQVPGSMTSHDPVVVSLSEVEKLALCDGGPGVGKFLVVQAARDVDGVRAVGLESAEKDRFVLLFDDPVFARVADGIRGSGETSKLLLRRTTFQRGDRECDEYIKAFPVLQEDVAIKEVTSQEVAATPSRRTRRQSKKSRDIEYVYDSDSDSNTQPKRTRVHNVEDDKLYLRYPIHENAQDVISIVTGDLNRLCPEEYLNDNLIDFALRIMVAEAEPALASQAHVFSCLFFSKMLEAHRIRRAEERDKEAYRLVAKWSRGVDIFDKNFIFVPINENIHWSLAVIVRPGASPDGPGDRPCVLHLDSMAMHNANKIHRYLSNYLQHEWARQQRPERQFNKQTIPLVKLKVPHQQNAFDCGVYTILFAEMIFHAMMPSREEDIRDRFKEYTGSFKITQQDVDVKRTQIRSLLEKVKGEWDETQQMQAALQQIKDAEQQGQQEHQEEQEQQQAQQQAPSEQEAEQPQHPPDEQELEHVSQGSDGPHDTNDGTDPPHQPPMDISLAQDEESSLSLSAVSES